MIKIEAIIDPLKYNDVLVLLNHTGVKRIKVFDIIGVRKSTGFILADCDNKYPFDLIPGLKFEILTDKEHSTNILNAIMVSAGIAQICIENIIIPTIDEDVKISIDKLLDNASNYSNN